MSSGLVLDHTYIEERRKSLGEAAEVSQVKQKLLKGNYHREIVK